MREQEGGTYGQAGLNLFFKILTEGTTAVCGADRVTSMASSWMEKSYRQGYATAQKPTVPAIFGVRITTLLLRTCNLTTIACGRWSLVAN